MNVYIINFNLLTWPREMVRILREQGHRVVIVDNGSTYGPLLEWYSTEPCRIVRTQNLGNRSPWLCGAVDDSDYYVVSDPDLDLSMVPPDWPTKLREGIERYGADRCGLSLDETRVPTRNPAWRADRFCDYPKGNPVVWGEKVKLAGGFIRYPVDTTFAVYRPKCTSWRAPGGIRTDRPYTARHLPWHIVPEIDPLEDSIQIPLDDELYRYYKATSRAALGESCTVGRMAQMISEYERTGI